MDARDAWRFRALALALMALALWSLLLSPHGSRPAGWWRPLVGWLGLWLASLFGMRAARVRRVAIVAFVLAGAMLARWNGNLSSLLVLGLGVLGSSIERPGFWWLAPPMAVAATWWLTGMHLASVPPGALFNVLFVVSLALLLGRLYRDGLIQRQRQERTLAELRAAHTALQAQAAQAEELAALRARSALARDLHDTLGHALSAVTVQLEAARRLARRDPARVDAVLAETQALTRSAMAELRGYVSALRGDGSGPPVSSPPPAAADPTGGADAVAALARDAARRNGWLLTLRLAPGLGPLHPAWLQVLREALTNVERHAGASAVTVALQRRGEGLELQVCDDGRGFVPGREGPGHFGLQGMRERMAELGGEVVVGSRPGGGTRLSARVPRDGGGGSGPALD